jgi:hypothetical protein
MEETEKPENEQNKTFISQLSETIINNSKVLADFGMPPLRFSRIKNLVTGKYNTENNKVKDELRRIKLVTQNIESAFHLIG